MRRPLALTVAVAVVLVLGAAGCGDDGGDEDETTASSTTEAGGASSSATDTTTAADGSTTTTAADGTSSTPSVPDEDLPGEPIDIYPYEGAVLAVVGVEADDTLNVRAGPGTSFDVVVELGPLAADATATGRNRTLEDDSLWVELEAEGTTGWVNGQYVAQLGGTTDVTSEVGQGIAGETMLAIGEAVAAARAPAGEGPQPTVTVVDGPTVGDLGEITVDVLGLADDSLRGERLHVFATPDPSGEGFGLKTVEATALCARGVTDDGLCT
ncbi:hypothetical protein HC251_17835 [Iamia sp. SCSIO 61187]|uniref:SH3 domain-containing protein n=1 Tax=Iamia sp. SCSIO 61187 TaxID=2722752 RepID=UPI001C62D425|nr:SH3 domain-containing protein [Iamia sp. SCSIO 61187]QYG94117.1 hypothetical protein HC251_17835 [Iamia sp. SCSIO 61187]